MKKPLPNGRFLSWADRIERFLLRFVIGGLVVLVVAQSLMTSDPIRFYLSFAERLEGKSLKPENPSVFSSEVVTNPAHTAVNQPVTAVPAGTLTLSLMNYTSLQKAVLLRNGEPVGDFRDKQLTIRVNDGDQLALDGSFYTYPLSFEVTSISDNITSPKAKQMIEVRHNVVNIGPVRIKDK